MRISFKILILLLSINGCSKSQSAADSDTDSVEIHTVINFVLSDTSMHWKAQTKILSEFTLLPPTRNYNQSYLSYLSDNLSEPDTICILNQTKGAKQFTARGMAKYGFTVVDLRELM